MEVWCQDPVATTMCHGKNQRVVSLVHQHLGRASVVRVTHVPHVPVKNGLRLKTANGVVFVSDDLRRVRK